MKNGGGLLLILGGIFAMWLYNTGRMAAILSVIRNPSQPPATTISGGTKTTGNTTGGAGGGGVTPGQVAACYAANASGMVDPACIDNIYKGLNSVDDIKSAINNVIGGIGIRL